MRQATAALSPAYLIRRRLPGRDEPGRASAVDARLRCRDRAAAEGLTTDDVACSHVAALAEDASVPYAVTDAYGKIVGGNDAAARLLGTDPVSLPGRRLRNFLVRESRSAFYAAMLRVREGDAVKDLGIVLRPPRSERVIPTTLSAVGKRGSSGELVAVHWFLEQTAPALRGAAEPHAAAGE